MLIALLVACGSSPAPPPPPVDVGTRWVDRTDAELEAELRAACERAAARDVNVLLEFSASWCIDCKQVAAMKPRIAPELANWERVTANVGRFDRHEPFIEAFGVGGIVHWVALAPTDCAAVPPAWPRLKHGTLEPASGKSGPKTPEDLRNWLVDARGG